MTRRLVTRVALATASAILVGCVGAGASAAPGDDQLAPDDPRRLTGPVTVEPEQDDVVPIADEVVPDLPVTVVGADGVEVEVTDVDRILAVDQYGTLAEIVFSLGLGDRVVGRDTSTGFPAAAHLPNVTPGGHDLNAEAILDLDPTVVLTDATIGPPEVVEQLGDAGIPVVSLTPERTFDGVGDHVRSVAAALGVRDEGEQVVARFEDELAAARARVPDDVGEPLRIAFLYLRGTAGVYLMAGPGSGADDLIEAVGGIDVGTDIGLTRAFTPLTSEALIAAEPDVLLLMSGGLESVGGVDSLVDRIAGVAQTPAGQRRRVIDVEDTVLLTFGPRSSGVVAALADALYATDGGAG